MSECRCVERMDGDQTPCGTCGNGACPVACHVPVRGDVDPWMLEDGETQEQHVLRVATKRATDKLARRRVVDVELVYDRMYDDGVRRLVFKGRQL